MKLKRINKCQFCGEIIEWNCIVSKSNSSSSLFDVETIHENEISPYRIIEKKQRDGYLYPLNVLVYCPSTKCGKLNEFKVEYDKENLV